MIKLDEIISTPSSEFEVTIKNVVHGFGLYEMQGSRPSQEDTAVACWYGEKTFASLTPQEIARRLWTTYKILNQHCCKPGLGGSTASSTVYDGKRNLITATLGDSVSFAVVYDGHGKISGVSRLNKIIHHPNEDKKRLEKAGGVISYGRVQGKDSTLAISRAMGDYEYCTMGVCDDAHIDITEIDSIVPGTIGTLQIITTCDGFTDPAPTQTKKGQEKWLLHCLLKVQSEGLLSESELARLLALEAFNANSTDNISVSVQTLFLEKPFLIGIYDGHNGALTSTYIAEHIATVFEQQCQLSSSEYTQQQPSADKYFEVYCRDNKDDAFYQPLIEKKNVRAAEVFKEKGIKEQIKRFASKKNEFVDEVVLAGEEIRSLMQIILAIDELRVFIESLCIKYVDLEIDKKDLLECFNYVLKDNFSFDHQKYEFLFLDFKTYRHSSELLKKEPGFKEIFDDLLAIFREPSSGEEN